jgi:hypothetical protein
MIPTPRRVIAAMVDLDKRYAENVGDALLFKRAARWLNIKLKRRPDQCFQKIGKTSGSLRAALRR